MTVDVDRAKFEYSFIYIKYFQHRKKLYVMKSIHAA
jgi:hypothetical protein